MYSQISLNLHIYRVDISLSEKDNLQLVPVILQLFPSDLLKKFGPMVGLFFSEADRTSEVEIFLFFVSIILPVAWEWLKAYLSSPVKTIQNNKLLSIQENCSYLISLFRQWQFLFLPTECPPCSQQTLFSNDSL